MIQTVLLWTHSKEHVGLIEEVTAEIRARGADVMRFDTDNFPSLAKAIFYQNIKEERYLLSTGGKTVELGDANAIWYRRVRYADALPTEMNEQLRDVAIDESRALLTGILAAAPCFIVDPPDRVRRSSHKILQQKIAKSVGLKLPRTLITNDPNAALDFVRTCPLGAVAKMLTSFAIHKENNEAEVVFTTVITEEHLAQIDSLRHCPMFFQERVPNRLEVRVTAIGTRLFSASVDSRSVLNNEVDWRREGSRLVGNWRKYSLPADIEASLHRFLQETQMQYSAIDLIVTPDDQHIFLEANPVGEFYWLSLYEPRFPLCAALADVLVDASGSRRVFGV